MVSRQPIVIRIANLSINGSLSTYLAEYEYSHLGGFPIIEFGEGNEPFSAFSSNYIHSYAEVVLGKQNKDQFEALKAEYWPQNQLSFDSEVDYPLQAFLPPMMQALMNRRGFFMNLIDCYSTAYGLKVDLETPRLNGGLFNKFSKLKGKKSDKVAAATIKSLKGLPVASVTNDRGKEFADHKTITKKLGIKVYFCDPYSSCQRGSNENRIGILRQYFPKGTDLSLPKNSRIRKVEAEINNRPMKCLDWKTPYEIMMKK